MQRELKILKYYLLQEISQPSWISLLLHLFTSTIDSLQVYIDSHIDLVYFTFFAWKYFEETGKLQVHYYWKFDYYWKTSFKVLQEIWSSEASISEEASREREDLISKPVLYYLLNPFQVLQRRKKVGGPTYNGSGYSAPLYDGSSASLSAANLQSESAISSVTSLANAPPSSLAIDDLLGLGLSATPAPAPLPPSLKLNSKGVLDPGTFQKKWHQLPLSLSQEFSMSPQAFAALSTPQSLLLHIASGGQSPNFKFFFAQKAEESSSFLIDCIINTSSAKAQIKIKTDYQSSSQAFSDVFQSALLKFSGV